MGRIIKFRGKSNDIHKNNEWIFGNLIYDATWNPQIYYFDGFIYHTIRVSKESVGEVVKTTRAGFDIYEGDIVEVKGRMMANDYLTKIKDLY